MAEENIDKVVHYDQCQLWRSEQGPDFAVPQEILDFVARGQMKDVSWHNEVCPHFEVQSQTIPINLWVTHPNPEQREMPAKRFLICAGERVTDDTTLLETDDVQEVVAYLNKHIEKTGGSYRRIDEPASFLITSGWETNERGNVRLFNEVNGQERAWFRLQGNLWLEVQVDDENSPGFRIKAITISDTDLAKWITENCVGWLVMKCNLDAVATEGGYVQEGE